MIRRAFVHPFWAIVPVLSVALVAMQASERAARAEKPSPAIHNLVRDFCLDCHSRVDPAAALDLESITTNDVEGDSETWEGVVRKLLSREMPPRDMPRPDESTYELAVAALEATLDRLATERPWPGRTDTFRRLTRVEYQNAIRDLLALDIEVSTWLPTDESSHGFDNVTVGTLSPTLLNRYVSAAQKISRLAVGSPSRSPGGETIRIRPDITQENHVLGLPIGTRGGVLIPYHFPQDGEYEIRVRLARDRNEHVEGLHGQHELEVLLDRERVELFVVHPPQGNDHSQVDAHLEARFRVEAGPHQLGVTFLRQSTSLLETSRQPYQTHFNMHRHPRINPAIYQVSITGPFTPTGPGDTPSRRRIFICRPDSDADEADCAGDTSRAGALRMATSHSRRGPDRAA